MAAGTPRPDDHVELHLPGDVLLSCRAEVEWSADGTPMRVVGVVRDVSDAQRQAQRFADLMAVMPGGVAVLDPAGRIVVANPGLCALLGARAEQLRGMSDGRHWPPSRRRAGSRAGCGRCRPAPSTATASTRRRCCAADGTTVWCELDVAGTHADDGSTQWLVVCTDVSERRRVAELLRRAGTDRRADPPAQPRRLPRAARPAAGRAGPRPRRRGVRRPRRLPARQLLPRPRRGRRPARHAGRAAAARPARRLHGGAPVRRRVRGDLRRPRRGGRPRPAREPGRRPAPHRDHRARQAGAHDGVGRAGHPGAHRRGARRRPAALRRGRDARRQAQAAPGRHRDGHRRRRQLGHPRAGAGGGAAGRDRGRRAGAGVPAGGRPGRRGAVARGAGALAAPGARADPARRVPAGGPAQRAAARAGPVGAAHRRRRGRGLARGTGGTRRPPWR